MRSFAIRRNNKKGIHLTTILIVLFFIFLAYVGVFWGMGWFASAKAQELMTKVILENAGTTEDSKLVEMMVETLRNEGKIETRAEDYTVLRGEGGKDVSVKLQLNHKVVFPPTDLSFDLKFQPSVLEDISKRGFK